MESVMGVSRIDRVIFSFDSKSYLILYLSGCLTNFSVMMKVNNKTNVLNLNKNEKNIGDINFNLTFMVLLCPTQSFDHKHIHFF